MRVLAKKEADVHYRRTPIELESPEQLGYDRITNNLSESSFSDMRLADYGIEADVGHDCAAIRRSPWGGTAAGARRSRQRKSPA